MKHQILGRGQESNWIEACLLFWICGVTENCTKTSALALALVPMCVFINIGALVWTLPNLFFQSI